ncbi:glutathione S-transferase N-terminal domain-containing protein [Microbulbifer sp. VAAC004]|uniref:glutathione S-transferase N-terminal domain-containing protein n=1 Tax=unclassified Microbulbifer TaxID=2619833 RepID=UPI00403A6565
MQLFLTYSSPFARKTRIVIEELKLHSRVSEVFSHPFHNTNDLISNNPLGKVPCLTLDNGNVIMDSEVICEFLDKQLGDGHLSSAIDNDWNLKTLYSVSSGLMEILVHRQVEKIRGREGLQSEFWWQRYNSAINRTLDFFEARVLQFPQTFCLLQIALGSALSYLDFRHEDFNWRKDRPQLSALSEILEVRESFKITPLRD